MENMQKEMVEDHFQGKLTKTRLQTYLIQTHQIQHSGSDRPGSSTATKGQKKRET
jgi:hypothetical protein